MGNVPVSIVIETSKKEKAYEAMEEAFLEAKRLENEISEWRPGSQTSLLNRSNGRYLVPIGGNLLKILTRAREISELTDGAFDITFASWKLHPPPTPSHQGRGDILFRNSLPLEGGGLGRGWKGYEGVHLIPDLNLAYLDPRIEIGISGIAKGAIVDRMAAVIQKEGFRRFLINAGDLYASGRWKIGIRRPETESERTVCFVTVKNRAVSTSGDYERGAHLIDPKTGRPTRPFKSITVIARNSTLADALATGLFVAGPEKIKSILKKTKGVEGAVWIDLQGAVGVWGDTSSGCRRRLL